MDEPLDPHLTSTLVLGPLAALLPTFTHPMECQTQLNPVLDLRIIITREIMPFAPCSSPSLVSRIHS